MNTKRLLLTGGSGLLGRTLAPRLTGRYEVTHFDVSDPGDGLPFTEGDLRDAGAVAEACRGMDAVLHLAALHGRAWESAGDDAGFAVNTVGTKNVLEGAAAAGGRRVVFTSSIWAAGHGPDPPYLPIDEDLPRAPAELYGLTKALGERMCRYTTSRYGVSTVVLRPGGIRPAEAYAPNAPGYLSVAVDVRDVASAHVLALEAGDDLRHDVFIVTADSPLCRVAPEAFRADPVAALESVVPGAARVAPEGGLELRRDMEWYTIAKARRVLGYEPEHNFRTGQ